MGYSLIIYFRHENSKAACSTKIYFNFLSLPVFGKLHFSKT